MLHHEDIEELSEDRSRMLLCLDLCLLTLGWQLCYLLPFLFSTGVLFVYLVLGMGMDWLSRTSIDHTNPF